MDDATAWWAVCLTLQLEVWVTDVFLSVLRQDTSSPQLFPYPSPPSSTVGTGRHWLPVIQKQPLWEGCSQSFSDWLLYAKEIRISSSMKWGSKVDKI